MTAHHVSSTSLPQYRPGAPATTRAPDPPIHQAADGGTGHSADDTPAARASAESRLDGRRTHVVDRATEYARLADLGFTAAQIARRRRKSKGHVSILLRLGRALADLPDEERAALRHPRITWRLVQRLVRTDVDPGSLRRQLRAALGGFSTHNLDGRRQRAAAPRTAPRTAEPRSAPAPFGIATTSAVAWGWDAAWFAQDPAGYAAAHLAHLTHLHQVVAERATHAVRARSASDLAAQVDAGQSLQGLQRRLTQLGTDPRQGPGPSAAEQAALAMFATLGQALAAIPGRSTSPLRTTHGGTPDDLVAADLHEP